MNTRQLFQQHLAQTSPEPVALHIASATGNYLTDIDGKEYIDLIGGISVCNVGHSHPKVIEAIKKQADQYLHVMVYGELVQTPQLAFAQKLAEHLPAALNSVYFTNSGAEACEAALKLARRVTGRPAIIAAHNSYHGHTMGALSVMGSEYWRNAFRPLLPGVQHYTYNSQEFIDAIDAQTGCVLIETVQSEAGIREPDPAWLAALRERCTQQGALLIMDEIQAGFGRTGKLWGFEHYGILPDIVLLGKALGGGMPMGAMIAGKDLMQHFTHSPVLGHMTTFGGHPVCCAAGLAALGVLLEEGLTEQVAEKEQLLHSLLVHPQIKAVRSKGLLMAVELENNAKVLAVLQQCLERGVFSDWFLFADNCIRIAPPLTITHEEIRTACARILACLD
ncbi:MAG: aspartate aminotransferase family protein [Chitinophagaceae bacterium]|nr:aspartate aminotransferase family protein [Chitinophagaceae bacterium]